MLTQFYLTVICSSILYLYKEINENGNISELILGRQSPSKYGILGENHKLSNYFILKIIST